MQKRAYDLHGSSAWERYYRRTFRNLPRISSNLVLLGLPHLEKQQGGLCHGVVAEYDQLAAASFISRGSVRKALNAVRDRCVEVKIGQSVINGAATEIRRLTVAEMQNPRLCRDSLRQHTPPQAESNAARLRGRPISYKGEVVYPCFSPSKTGRIYTSKPNLQGDGEEKRMENIGKSLTVGEWFMEVDYKTAEPTVLRHILKESGCFNLEWPADPYQLLATLRSLPRATAKKEFLASFYHANTRAAFHSMGIMSNTFFSALADAMERYKEDLWRKGKPSRGVRRHTRTLGGTLIEALSGESMHRGKLLSWQVQGTVADIMNSVMNELLKREATDKWRVIYPEHDSVIVAADRNCSPEIEGIMKAHAELYKIPLQVKSSTYQNCDERTPPLSCQN